MKVSDIKPLAELKSVLVAEGILGDIYESGVPTASIPNSYISIMQNGSVKPKTINLSYSEAYIMLTVSVKLLSTGIVNTTMESLILDGIGTLFEGNKQVESNGYLFSLDTNNLGGGGRGISSGYSTKIINLLVKIY